MKIIDISVNSLPSFSWFCFQVLRLLTLLVAIYGFLFYFTNLAGAEHFHQKVSRHPVLWGMHVLGGSSALLVSTFVFSRRSGFASFNLHRWLGYLYVTAVIISAAGGLALSFDTDSGLVSGVGLATLAVLWIYATAQSVRYAVLKNHHKHWIWVQRSFALTLSAVFFRLDLGVMMYFLNADYRDIYATVTWHSWVVTLIIMEWGFMENSTLKKPGATMADSKSHNKRAFG